MTTPNPVLSEMINEAPEQVAAAEKNLDQINETQSDLEDKSTAIEEGVCGAAAADATNILELTIAPDKGGYVWYGPNFAQISWDPPGTLTDFEIRDSTTHISIYVYNIGDYPDLDAAVDDFTFGNDYITHPLGSDAAYGLDPLIAAYETAKTVVTAGKNKVEASVDVLERYL